MSIPPSQNQAIQMSIASNIGSQTAIFQQMNALLRTMNNVVAQLNVGFKALTSAIIQNTTIMARLTVGGPNALMQSMGLKGRIGAPAGPNTMALMAELEKAFLNLNKPLMDLVGDINTLAVPALKDLGVAVSSKKKNPQIESLKGTLGLNSLGLLNPFKNLQSTYLQSRNQAMANMQSGGMGYNQSKGGGQMIGMASATGSFLKQAVTGPFKVAGAAISPLTSALSSMGPQMMALSLVMGPIMDFLNAFLEPLSVLSEYFAGFGGILSQLLVPVMAMITPLLDSVMGILMDLVPMLMPLMTQLFQLTGIGMLTQILIPLMPLISSLVQLAGLVINALTPILGIVTGLIPIIMTSLMPAINFITDAITNTTKIITDNFGAIQKIVSDVVNAVLGYFTGLWDDLGTLITGGGADKHGWW